MCQMSLSAPADENQTWTVSSIPNSTYFLPLISAIYLFIKSLTALISDPLIAGRDIAAVLLLFVSQVAVK